jgi:hypothetical protein
VRGALTFLLAAVAGFGATAALRPAGDPPPFTRGAPAGEFYVEGSVPDAYGRPPGVPRASRAKDFPQPPPWAVVVWRDRRGRWCHEAGTLVSDDTPGRGDQLPGVRATESTFPRPLVGSMRPDAKSGTGIQFYDVGRFLGYPLAEGGSCGDPAAGPGLIVSLEHRFARRDLGPDRTVVSGVAHARVREVRVGGRVARLGSRRSFIALLDGLSHPDVEVRYADGTRRTLRFPFAGVTRAPARAPEPTRSGRA